MKCLADPRRLPPTARDHPRALPDELCRDRATDAARRARHEAGPSFESEFQGSSSVSPVTLIILARHGETDWNRDGIWQGHGDPPLNALGRRQAAGLADRLADVEIDALYSSDLRRAYETAEIIGVAKGLAITADRDLREMDVGSWSGLTSEEIQERFPEAGHHDGESREAFDTRAVAALGRIARAHEGGPVLVVTHGGVVRALDRHVFGEPRSVLGNCETAAFRFEGTVFARLD